MMVHRKSANHPFCYLETDSLEKHSTGAKCSFQENTKSGTALILGAGLMDITVVFLCWDLHRNGRHYGPNSGYHGMAGKEPMPLPLCRSLQTVPLL
jgi:hypothetical protein